MSMFKNLLLLRIVVALACSTACVYGQTNDSSNELGSIDEVSSAAKPSRANVDLKISLQSASSSNVTDSAINHSGADASIKINACITAVIARGEASATPADWAARNICHRRYGSAVPQAWLVALASRCSYLTRLSGCGILPTVPAAESISTAAPPSLVISRVVAAIAWSLRRVRGRRWILSTAQIRTGPTMSGLKDFRSGTTRPAAPSPME